MQKKFNLKEIYHKDRPMSWSAISSFEWRPSDWYKRYVLKEENPTSPEMTFGKIVGEKLASDPLYLPHVERLPVFEHELRGLFNGIPLIGYMDGYDAPNKVLIEYKTGRKLWDAKRALSHGQIDMYLLILYLRDKIRPEDMSCKIIWLPTHIANGEVSFVDEKDVKVFETRRTMQQVLAFGQRIKDVYAAMEAYAEREAQKEVHSLSEWH